MITSAGLVASLIILSIASAPNSRSAAVERYTKSREVAADAPVSSANVFAARFDCIDKFFKRVAYSFVFPF